MFAGGERERGQILAEDTMVYSMDMTTLEKEESWIGGVQVCF
jgi:hypothetical protein